MIPIPLDEMSVEDKRQAMEPIGENLCCNEEKVQLSAWYSIRGNYRGAKRNTGNASGLIVTRRCLQVQNEFLDRYARLS